MFFSFCIPRKMNKLGVVGESVDLDGSKVFVRVAARPSVPSKNIEHVQRVKTEQTRNDMAKMQGAILWVRFKSQLPEEEVLRIMDSRSW